MPSYTSSFFSVNRRRTSLFSRYSEKTRVSSLPDVGKFYALSEIDMSPLMIGTLPIYDAVGFDDKDPRDLTMNPEKARHYRKRSIPRHKDSSTMCGNMYAVRNMEQVLAGKDILLTD